MPKSVNQKQKLLFLLDYLRTDKLSIFVPVLIFPTLLKKEIHLRHIIAIYLRSLAKTTQFNTIGITGEDHLIIE